MSSPHGHGLTLRDWLGTIEELETTFGREADLAAKGDLKNPIRRRETLSTAEIVYAT